MADDSYTLEITNQAAFDAAMAQITANLADLKGPLAAAAGELAREAAGAAPIRTGRLAGSHRAENAAATRVRIVADTPYAAPIHWGWPGHNIRRQPWLVATWMRSDGPRNKMADAIQSDIDKAAAKT